MFIYEFIDPEIQLTSKDFNFIEHFIKSTGRTQLGWHYIVDIIWIYSLVKSWSRNFKILDAGGGHGPIQFLLAEMGFHVINIDMNLIDLPIQYKYRYKSNIETLPSFKPTNYARFLDCEKTNSLDRIKVQLKKIIKTTPMYSNWCCRKYSRLHNTWRSSVGLSDTPIGIIEWRRGNLCNMPEINSNYFDAVVSLSALEHIPYSILDTALTEIHRVLKPDAKWAVTTSATEKEKTWWHEPSQSNCFSINDLENIFEAKSYRNQNPDKILKKYNQCEYLKDNIAKFYKKSSKYGMPWGTWRPEYIPVGLGSQKCPN